MAKDPVHQLKADLKACRAEVDGLMQARSLMKEQHGHDIRAARAVEHQKIASLASAVEVLSRLVRDAHIPSTK